jgi:NADPH:quinone reductase-like Zn-dependent oxidoreductase
MKAVVIEAYGGPEMLAFADLPQPRPGPEDMLVRVRAAGVNRADCLLRAGTYPVPPGVRFSPVPGLEVAGEVLEVLADSGEPVEYGQPLFLIKI